MADLVEDVRDGRCLVVAGAGVSASATGGDALSTWTGLLHDGVERCGVVDATIDGPWRGRLHDDIDSGRLNDLIAAAERVQQTLNAVAPGEWARWLRDTVGALQVRDDSLVRAIDALRAPILTTNYDDTLSGPLKRPYAAWTDSNRIRRVIEGADPAIGHLHGHWETPSSVVMGLRSYDERGADGFAQALAVVAAAVKTMVLIGVGDGASDPDFAPLRRWMGETLGTSEARHYRLCLDSEIGSLTELHRGERIVPLAYGAVHTDLTPFLAQVARDAFSPGGVGAPASGLRVAIGVLVRGEEAVLVRRLEKEGDLDWQFPAGIVKPTEEPQIAVTKEVQKETGIVCHVEEYLGEREHPGTGVPCQYFKLRYVDGVVINGDPQENVDARWVHRDRICDYIQRDSIFEPVRKALGLD